MASEKVLSDVLSEFARTMLTEFPIQRILDQLVRRIVEVLPISAAGVTLISPGTVPRYVAASNESALRFEKLQTELGEGPCLAAYQTGEAVAIADLRADVRFGTFAPRAVAEGLAAVFTFPLRHGDRPLGALDLYRDLPGPLDPGAMVAAQTLADVASAYLLNAQARVDLQDLLDRSRQLSLHDELTGLPNRTLLVERLDHALERGRRSGKSAAVLFVDLDDFKLINDLHGHRVGDELLIAVAGRLSAHLRPGDTLARLHGDEFVLLCEDLASGSDVDAIVARTSEQFVESFALSGVEVKMSASIGVAFAGRADHLPETLIDRADRAMYEVKRAGGGHHLVVDLGEGPRGKDVVDLRLDLYRALAEEEFWLAYQPIVETVDGWITGVEALLRWEHPSQGPVPPSVVIPVAEQSGVIVQIGRWALQQACKDRHRWRTDSRSDALGVSVNVSGVQLMSAGYAATVENVLAATHTDPKLVTLEVTESVFMHDSHRALVVFRDLKDLGVRLALDDFGTGYSSLSYLRKLPVDTVKIDQTFIAEVGREPGDHAIVSAIVELSHALGLTAIAEGVETSEQLRALIALGCDACQGLYFAAPMSADAVNTLLGEDSSHRTPGRSLLRPTS